MERLCKDIYTLRTGLLITCCGHAFTFHFYRFCETRGKSIGIEGHFKDCDYTLWTGEEKGVCKIKNLSKDMKLFFFFVLSLSFLLFSAFNKDERRMNWVN